MPMTSTARRSAAPPRMVVLPVHPRPKPSPAPTSSSPCCQPGRHVRQVWSEDIIPHVGPGALLIDCSTIDVDSARFVQPRGGTKGLAIG